MDKPLSTLFPYVGGKARQAKFIASIIDKTPHSTYIEACCGSAVVFFTKKPVKNEIINDVDQKFPLLFKALRDNKDKVIDFCSKIDYSKLSFDESYYHLRGNPDTIPEWKLGCWALFQCISSHAGYPDAHSFAWRTKGSNPAINWLNKIEKLAPYIERLKSTVITNYDIFKLLKRADKPGVLLYVDPPYFGAEHRYKITKGKFDHEKLANALKSLKNAKVLISHYDSEPYCSLYSKWSRTTIKSTQSCIGSTKDSSENKGKVVESVWYNYAGLDCIQR